MLTLPGASLLDNIRALYGSAVANNLLPLSLKVGAAAAAGPAVNGSSSGTGGKQQRQQAPHVGHRARGKQPTRAEEPVSAPGARGRGACETQNKSLPPCPLVQSLGI